MIKLWKYKPITKEAIKVTVIVLDKIEATVPKVVSAVANLRADRDAWRKEASTLMLDNADKQKKIDELEAILASLVSEGGESAGGVV